MKGHGKRLRGLRQDRGKWRAYLRVDGRYYSKWFPRETSIDTMQQWRLLKRAAIRENRPPLEPIPLTRSQKDRVVELLGTIASWDCYNDDSAVNHFCADFLKGLEALI